MRSTVPDVVPSRKAEMVAGATVKVIDVLFKATLAAVAFAALLLVTILRTAIQIGRK